MKKGIWRYDFIFDNILPSSEQISLGEGNNTVLRLLHNDFRELHLLREDDNPSNSHKDRCIAYLISLLNPSAQKGYVISSSGNAGISLAKYAKSIGKPAVIFLKHGIPGCIVEKILSLDGYPVISHKPVNYSNISERILGYTNMRATLNPLSSQGYRSIPAEITLKGLNFDSWFIYSTSFSTAVGILEGFEKLNSDWGISIPAVYAVISGDFHPFDKIIEKKYCKNGICRLITKSGIEILFLGNPEDGIWDDSIRTGGFCPRDRFLYACKLIGKHGGSLIYYKNSITQEQDDFLQYYRVRTSFQSETAIKTAYYFQRSGIVNRPLVIQSGAYLKDSASPDSVYAQYIVNNLDELKKRLENISDNVKNRSK